MEKQIHSIPPVWDGNSEILILGSFPSVKSREVGFFYGHPQNRFWRVTAAVLGAPLPESIADKRNFLLENKIALWDVIQSCRINGSSDASIQNIIPNNILPIIENSKIKRVFVNGTTAAKLYEKHILPMINIPAIKLPSTSPANAAWSFEKLCLAWRVIR